MIYLLQLNLAEVFLKILVGLNLKLGETFWSTHCDWFVEEKVILSSGLKHSWEKFLWI